MKKKKLNLNNPIFVVYVNVDSLPTARKIEKVKQIKETLDIYSNIEFWILAVENGSETKIECIFDGISKSPNLSKMIEEITKKIDVISNSKSIEEFKVNIRNWKIESIL